MSVNELLEMSGKRLQSSTWPRRTLARRGARYLSTTARSETGTEGTPYNKRVGFFRREMAAPDGMYPEGWLDLIAE